MNRYQVPIGETRSYRVEVEAETPSEAMDKADVMIENGQLPEPYANRFEVIDAFLIRERNLR